MPTSPQFSRTGFKNRGRQSLTSELRGVPYNFVERLQSLALPVDKQLRVADDVDQQDVTDLQLKIWLSVSHIASARRESFADSWRRRAFRGKNSRDQHFRRINSHPPQQLRKSPVCTERAKLAARGDDIR